MRRGPAEARGSATFYKWKAKCGGLGVSDHIRLPDDSNAEQPSYMFRESRFSRHRSENGSLSRRIASRAIARSHIGMKRFASARCVNFAKISGCEGPAFG
jgi:hypothetical protein